MRGRSRKGRVIDDDEQKKGRRRIGKGKEKKDETGMSMALYR